MIPQIYQNNISARSIINSKIQSAEKPLNKYNHSIQQNIENYIDQPLSDYRDGSDTGIEPEYHNQD